METEMRTFVNEEFGSVRTFLINGTPWFVGKDIATILGYREPHKAVARLVSEDDGMKHPIIDRLGRTQNAVLVNESGFYSLLLASKLPTARNFKHWVTSEVLPAIRTTGGYVWNDEQFIEHYLPFADDAVKNLFRLNLMMIRQLNTRIEKEEPLVEFANQVAGTENVISMNEMAKLAMCSEIPIGRNRLYRWLKLRGILMWNNLPYQKYIDRGYFVVKESLFDAGGFMRTYRQTYVTGKGQQFIIGLLKQYRKEGMPCQTM